MAVNNVFMDGEAFRKRLEDLAWILPDDKFFQLILCGGAVLSMYYSEYGNYITNDADVFDYYNTTLPDELIPYIDQVAIDNGLGYDWLNDAIVRHDDLDYLHNLKISEYIMMIDNPFEPEYFYNSNDVPVMELYHLSIYGLIAAKIIANRDKDYKALKKIIPQVFTSLQDADNQFKTYAKSFTSSEHYKIVYDRLKEFL